jgi:hypothetical protein
MIKDISYQKAVALCKKHLGCKVPPKGESYLMPHGVKLYNGSRAYFIAGYAYDNSDVKAFCKENNID